MAWSKSKTAALTGLGILIAIGATINLKNKAERDQDFVAYAIQHKSFLQKVFPRKVDDNKLRRQLVGVWRIAADKSWGADDFSYFSEDTRRYKIWTLTNWSVASYDENSNLLNSASGPYDLRGDLYTETIQEATGGMKKFLGARPRFKIRVDGDAYYQMATGKKPFIEEMWVRVKP